MKSITVKMLAALTTVALVGLFAQSSFAAKAMSDSELDHHGQGPVGHQRRIGRSDHR